MTEQMTNRPIVIKATDFKVTINKPPVPQHIIDAVRVVLGINTQRGDDRKQARRIARQQLRVWLSEIGAATPKELIQAAQANRQEKQNG